MCGHYAPPKGNVVELCCYYTKVYLFHHYFISSILCIVCAHYTRLTLCVGNVEELWYYYAKVYY